MKAIKNILGYIFSEPLDQNVSYYCKMMRPALIAITVLVLFKSWIIFGNYHFSDETLLDALRTQHYVLNAKVVEVDRNIWAPSEARILRDGVIEEWLVEGNWSGTITTYHNSITKPKPDQVWMATEGEKGEYIQLK